VLRRVLVVVAVVTGMAASGAAAGASVPAAPRRAATFDGRIRVVAASGDTIYVGGHFTHATGLDGRTVTRNRVAAVDATSGALLPWNPNANHPVYALAVAGGAVYLGGDFSSVGGAARGRLAAVDAASGAIVDAFRGRVRYSIHALAATADGVYAAGDGSGGHLVAWTPTGALKFPTVQTDGGAQAVTVLGGEVYAGGHWDNVCPEGVSQGTGGGFNCAGSALTRHKLLSVDEATGRLTDWNPGANSPLGVFGLTAAGGTLAAGGDFTRVAGVARGHFALFG
jgi:hypothetical protein